MLYNSHSPDGVANFSDVEVPGLMAISDTETTSSSSSDDDDSSDEENSHMPPTEPPGLMSATATDAVQSYMQRAAALHTFHIQYYTGDILESPSTILVHQTNCTSRVATGLTKSIFEKFPHSECYAHRTGHAWPGEIQVHSGHALRIVVNIHGQYYPGPPMADGIG